MARVLNMRERMTRTVTAILCAVALAGGSTALDAAGAPSARTPLRIWLFTPALPHLADSDIAARPIEATSRLAKALRADDRVLVVDAIDVADVIVEVGAVRRTVYGKDGARTLENVTLTINAGE